MRRLELTKFLRKESFALVLFAGASQNGSSTSTFSEVYFSPPASLCLCFFYLPHCFLGYHLSPLLSLADLFWGLYLLAQWSVVAVKLGQQHSAPSPTFRLPLSTRLFLPSQSRLTFAPCFSCLRRSFNKAYF